MPFEYQRYGRNKKTLVNHTYINSGVYRRKFDKITDNSVVNRILYAKAKEMLLHRSGTMLEDMYWIDGTTGQVVASALREMQESSVAYSSVINEKIEGNSNLIAMHTHPSSMPPSIADFNSAYIHSYAINLVICHNGSIYVYCSKQQVSQSIYERYIGNYILMGYSEIESQIKALTELKKSYNIDFWEV